MKQRILLFVLSFVVSTFAIGQENGKIKSDVGVSRSVSWAYLGQTPPGEVPQIFAPNIFSDEGGVHTFPAISNDGKSILWMKLPPEIFFMEYSGNQWSKPGVFHVLKDTKSLRPIFSSNDQRIYFSSGDFPDGKGSLDIWYIEKTDTGYSAPKNLGNPVNTQNMETAQSFSGNGNIYYTGYVKGKRWDRGLLYSKHINGKYTEPEILDETINLIDVNAVDYLSFIARDESFILFSSNRHNLSEEDCRIYISFKNARQKWDTPINLSEKIGFDHDSRDPYISPDGQYLFFSGKNNIYWVNTSVIDELKVKK